MNTMKKDDKAKAPSDYREWHKNIEQAQSYDNEVFAEDSYSSYTWEIEKGILIKEINLIDNSNIKYLDFACGTGRVISFVEHYVAESTGVDVSESMLKLAKTKTKKSELLHHDLTVNDIISNNKYDLITSFRFFLNAQEDLRKEIMMLLSRKLSSDGIFIFNTHGNTLSSHFLPVILSRVGLKQERTNHLSYFEMRKLAEQANLRIKRVYGIGFVPSLFYRMYKPMTRVCESIDHILLNCTLLKYFAKNLIFVCAKK